MRVLFRYLAIAAALLLAFLVLAGALGFGFYVHNNYRAWEETQAELAAKGEKLSMAGFVPPPIPGEQNFFADPMWDEIAETAVKGENGTVIYVPRTPVEKQQLRLMEQRLSPADQAYLQKEYPLLQDLNLDESCRGFLLKAWARSAQHDAAWRGQLARLTLKLMASVAPTLEKVQALLQRTDARYPIDYQFGALARMPHFTPLLSLAQVLSMRARAQIQLGDSHAALADFSAVVGLADSLRREPFALSVSVRCACLDLAAKVVAIGIAGHVWNEAQLKIIEKRLGMVDILAEMVRAVRGERASANLCFDWVRTSSAKGGHVDMIVEDNRPTRPYVGYSNICGPGDQALLNRLDQKMIDAASSGGWPAIWKIDFNEAIGNPSMIFRLSHILTMLSNPIWESTFLHAAFAQESLVQMRLACALERYYLAHREYPPALTDLAPEYLSAVPPDILTGQSMHYERVSPEVFRLWSVGWDGTDDGGQVSAKKSRNKGDWVWGLSY